MRNNGAYLHAQKITDPRPKARMQLAAMATVPGTTNGWSRRYLPNFVEPVSSSSAAAMTVGYVGRTKSADAAGKAHTMAALDMFKLNPRSMITLVVIV